ncbi:MAG: glutathione peroxidase [Flavobacteriales bacterium]|jgi:glutathione peroxidase|nr:glutathione peroxidase [Flavobacteriales bacterium]|tara:strand:- start:1968 stop:2486 length:519 start_codon:yes stop_codon:yes gene_type:complete
MTTFQVKSQEKNNQTIYQFSVEDLYGEIFDFSKLKGKKIMIVNTASKCGLTPQYKALQSLYEKFSETDFVIVGFPANNFLWQEPGTNEEIAEFCAQNYGVTFPMMGKVSVVGLNQHPIYSFLTKKKLNGSIDSMVTWNFQKFLIDENGYVVKSISPRRQPDDEEIINWINGS